MTWYILFEKSLGCLESGIHNLEKCLCKAVKMEEAPSVYQLHASLCVYVSGCMLVGLCVHMCVSAWLYMEKADIRYLPQLLHILNVKTCFSPGPQAIVLNSLACLLIVGFLFLSFYMLGWQVDHRTHVVCTDLGILDPNSSPQAFMANILPVEPSHRSLNNFILNNRSSKW